MSSEGLTVDVKHTSSGREFEVAGVAAAPDITERIRLEGIDVPDVHQQPWGEAAKAYLEQQLQHQTVLLETDCRTTRCDRSAIGVCLAERCAAQRSAGCQRLCDCHAPSAQ